MYWYIDSKYIKYNKCNRICIERMKIHKTYQKHVKHMKNDMINIKKNGQQTKTNTQINDPKSACGTAHRRLYGCSEVNRAWTAIPEAHSTPELNHPNPPRTRQVCIAFNTMKYSPTGWLISKALSQNQNKFFALRVIPPAQHRKVPLEALKKNSFEKY